MNLLGRKKSGLILLLALVLLGCEDPNEIGLELKANSDRVGVYYYELELPTSIIQNDSILTSSSARLLVGNTMDDEFGHTTAKGFTQFSFGQTVKTIPEEAEYDSVYLLLSHDYNFGPGINTPQSFLIHELTEDLNDTIAYFSFDEAAYNETPIGQQAFWLPDFAVSGTRDTLLTMSLDDSFGMRLFESLQDTNIVKKGDNEKLHELFKGIAIVGASENNSIARFDPNIDQSALILYYHVDTLAISYDFGFYNGANFNQILADRTGTELEGIKDIFYEDFHPANNNAYLQAGTGLLTKVDMLPMISFFDSLENVTLNKVDIEFTVNLHDYNKPPPSVILLYYANERNRRIRNGSEYLGILREGTADLYNLEYISSIQAYNAPITLYADNLIKGGNIYNQLLIYPFDFGYFHSVNQFQIVPENAKLKIYYTKLK